MRIVKTALLLLLVLAITIFAARLLIVNKLTALALHKSGAEEISIHLSAIGLRQTHIQDLAATFKLPSGERIPVSMKDISISYTLPQLLATGKCDRVRIKLMTIDRTAVDRASNAPFTLPEQISLLRDELRARLPLAELRVERLLLQGDLPPQLTGKEFQLDASVQGKAVGAAITLQLAEDTRVTLNLQSDDALHTGADISGIQGRQKIFQARLNLQPGELSGTLSLQLKPVRKLVLHNVQTSRLPEVNAQLDGDFTLPLPLPGSANIQASFTLRDNDGHLLQLAADGSPTREQLSLKLNGKYQEQEFLNTDLTVAQRRVSGSYQLDSGPLRSFLRPYIQQAMPEVSGKLAGSLDLPLPDGSGKPFTFTAFATAPAMTAFSSAAAELQLTGEVTDKAIRLDHGSTLQVDKTVLPRSSIDALSMDLAGDFRLLADRLLLNFADGQTLRIKGVTTGKLHIEDIRLQPHNPLLVSIHKDSWTVAANSLRIDPLLISEGKRSYTTGPLTCRLSSLEKSGTGPPLSLEVSTPSFIYRQNSIVLPLKNLTATVLLKDNLVNAELLFSPETIPGRVKGTISHDLNRGDGSLSLRTVKRFDLNQEKVSLAQLFTAWHFPFDLDSGMVSFKADGSWYPDEKLQLSAFTAVTGGNGFYKQFFFKGLDIRQDLAVLPRLYSKSEGSFSLQQLIGAVDSHDIRAGVNLLPSKQGPRPEIQINNFRASLFDGTLTSSPITYDLNQPVSDFTVNINGMDLATLIQLIKMNDLHVTGRVSGTIPVRIRGKEISVDNGALLNDPPGGEIRYTPANMDHEGLTGYALKAVQNFHYDSLKTTARYLPSGQLDLDIGLQGISPGLESSRPVHLNIHAEQNLPALLQSLRFSKGLTEKLDKRLKQHYK